jgi:ParB family chromosome partitioning protein
MAKRRRLTPAQPLYLAEDPAPAERGPIGLPPIAQVAGEAASSAALREVSDEMQRLRRDGRLIQRLPPASIDADYLVRDRIALDDDEMQTLMASLRARGQQTPIEVVALGPGRYGLISGWRRMTALGRLHAETGDDRFATVLALIRQPDGASDAYLAMVEENEIRVGLSFYERARIAARAAEQGVFPSPQLAVRALFAAASRAKRSKIMSFLAIHAALDPALRFPSALSERAGLALARALEGDATLAPRLRERLRKSAPQSAEAELALLARAAEAAPALPVPQVDGPQAAHPADRPADPAPPEGPLAGSPGLHDPAAAGERPLRPALPVAAGVPPVRDVAGLVVQSVLQDGRVQVTLTGPKATAALHDRLLAWLAAQG